MPKNIMRGLSAGPKGRSDDAQDSDEDHGEDAEASQDKEAGENSDGGSDSDEDETKGHESDDSDEEEVIMPKKAVSAAVLPAVKSHKRQPSKAASRHSFPKSRLHNYEISEKSREAFSLRVALRDGIYVRRFSSSAYGLRWKTQESAKAGLPKFLDALQPKQAQDDIDTAFRTWQCVKCGSVHNLKCAKADRCLRCGVSRTNVLQFGVRPKLDNNLGGQSGWGRTKEKINNSKSELRVVRRVCLKKMAKCIHRHTAEALHRKYTEVAPPKDDEVVIAAAQTKPPPTPAKHEAKHEEGDSKGNKLQHNKLPPIRKTVHPCESLEPRKLCISYPGLRRAELMQALVAAGLDLVLDVHAMAQRRVAETLAPNWVPLEDVEHLKEFRLYEGWAKMKAHCSSLELSFVPNYEMDPVLKATLDKENKFGLVPAWFVHEWTKAAVYAARNGLGIILFTGWEGYDDSPWCKLERLFLIDCLVLAYPGSVLVHNALLVR
jgi:hypothetical protein